jgi:hypothetical protein
VVMITDTCPCYYPDNYASNKRWCCGDMYHLDLSVWAFEKVCEPQVRSKCRRSAAARAHGIEAARLLGLCCLAHCKLAFQYPPVPQERGLIEVSCTYKLNTHA